MKNNDHELLYHYELKLHIIHKLMVHLKDIFKSIMIQVYYWLQNDSSETVLTNYVHKHGEIARYKNQPIAIGGEQTMKTGKASTQYFS